MPQSAEFPTLMDYGFDEFCKSYGKETAAAAKVRPLSGT